MSEPPYLKKENRTTNEPKVHKLIEKSIIFVPTAGMRLAPETLVLELMREVFFDISSEDLNRAKDLKPEELDFFKKSNDLKPDQLDKDGQPLYSNKERAVLYALQGRRKKAKNSLEQKFFAPAYPHLAKKAWFRKNSERVINNFLIAGPIRQQIWRNTRYDKERTKYQEKFAFVLTNALIGGNSCFDQNLGGKEILAAILGPQGFDQSLESARKKIELMTNLNSELLFVDDELANRITEDLIAICELEPKLPRMQWLQLLMTFLRFALPMWLLAHMRITCLVHGWLLQAADRGTIVEKNTIEEKIKKRNQGLLHPTLTPTRELYEHIDRYMKRRVELDILLHCVEDVNGKSIESKKRLTFEGGGGKDVLSFDILQAIVREASEEIRSRDYFGQVADGHNLTIGTFLTREGQHFLAWRNPRGGGPGKNIDEFFRVLYRAETGDEAGGHLLSSEGKGGTRGFRVFPGQLLLKTITFLAAQRKGLGQKSGSGMLVLQDVEDHFSQYGIDFSNAADARPLLMNELQAMGLLRGSPDAGSSVAVANPYS
jgi:hypothetical protein